MEEFEKKVDNFVKARTEMISSLKIHLEDYTKELIKFTEKEKKLKGRDDFLKKLKILLKECHHF